jgi:hypothetical protein
MSDSLKEKRDKLIRDAEAAAHKYAASCDLGPERERAFEVFQNLRYAPLGAKALNRGSAF